MILLFVYRILFYTGFDVGYRFLRYYKFWYRLPIHLRWWLGWVKSYSDVCSTFQNVCSTFGKDGLLNIIKGLKRYASESRIATVLRNVEITTHVFLELCLYKICKFVLILHKNIRCWFDLTSLWSNKWPTNIYLF